TCAYRGRESTTRLAPVRTNRRSMGIRARTELTQQHVGEMVRERQGTRQAGAYHVQKVQGSVFLLGHEVVHHSAISIDELGADAGVPFREAGGAAGADQLERLLLERLLAEGGAEIQAGHLQEGPLPKHLPEAALAEHLPEILAVDVLE